jgi:hypothetical protein
MLVPHDGFGCWFWGLFAPVFTACCCGVCCAQVLKSAFQRDLTWQQIAWALRAMMEYGAVVLSDTFELVPKAILDDLKTHCRAAFKEASAATGQPGGSPVSSTGATECLEALWPMPVGAICEAHSRASIVYIVRLYKQLSKQLFVQSKSRKRQAVAEDTAAPAKEARREAWV